MIKLIEAAEQEVLEFDDEKAKSINFNFIDLAQASKYGMLLNQMKIKANEPEPIIKWMEIDMSGGPVAPTIYDSGLKFGKMSEETRAEYVDGVVEFVRACLDGEAIQDGWNVKDAGDVHEKDEL